LNSKKEKIILFNPRSALHNHRLPLSILQIGASIFGKHDFVFVDGNLENDPWDKLNSYLETGEFAFFACTVMPGPQLKQATRVTKAIREKFPGIITIWGGYFASNHYRVCLDSGVIDYIIRGPGDYSFPKLINYLLKDGSGKLSEIANLVFRTPAGELVVNPMDPVPDQDDLPEIPYTFLDQFYPLEKYIVKTFIGDRTLSFHSSIGCPHLCSFCGVASIYNSGWKGKSAGKMTEEILHLKARYRIDAIEFHDSNFFCSRSRVMEFCRLMKDNNIRWWAEGRVDTLNQYSDEELQLIRDSGCSLVFMGAETGNDLLLSRVNKGSTFSVNDTVELVKRFRDVELIPELSFVLGFPDSTSENIMKQIHDDINFIRSLKKMNPTTEVILYLFSPVPFEGSALFKTVQDYGFIFPSSLDEWLTGEWENVELRRGEGLPWLQPSMIRFIRNFEVVMMAAYPSKSNFHINRPGKYILQILGRIRYKLRWYRFPFELKALLKLFSYQRPEKEGFYLQ
jgi:anaerobic magnesium-protoporphyrin IX monomethyl ester cyclase